MVLGRLLQGRSASPPPMHVVVWLGSVTSPALDASGGSPKPNTALWSPSLPPLHLVGWCATPMGACGPKTRRTRRNPCIGRSHALTAAAQSTPIQEGSDGCCANQVRDQNDEVKPSSFQSASISSRAFRCQSNARRSAYQACASRHCCSREMIAPRG